MKTYHAGPVTDHFDGQRFHNLHGPNADRGLGDVLRWRRQRSGTPWPPAVTTVPMDQPPTRVAGLRVVLVGHASLLIQVAGQNILVDPVWSNRASPVSFLGPQRHTRPAIAFDALPPIDTVLITHNHYDHLDIATLKRLCARHHPRLIAPLGNDLVIRRAAETLVVATLDWDQRLTLTEHVTVTCFPANHWSARSLSDRRRALWCGYVLHTPAGPIYVAGDTAYGTGTLFYRLLRLHGAPLLAILPIGAYAPRWFMRNQHMNPAEAVQAFRDCRAQHGLGIHWGTFRLTDEPQDAPLAALAAARARHGIRPERFVAMHPGQVWSP